MRLALLLIFALINTIALSQFKLKGQVMQANTPASFATIIIKETNQSLMADSLGQFIVDLKPGDYTFKIQSFDSYPLLIEIETKKLKENTIQIFELKVNEKLLEEVVISGHLREVNKLKSTVPVEIYNPIFFQRNPTPNIYEALQNINGVRPQLNCNICNTGDIHINGLEGPYTMILIDGMPIVSSLSSVYGLSGIPNSLVERIEIVRGPSSALYGSEAIGGLINIITKSPENAPRFSADVFSNSWLETNVDLGYTLKRKRLKSLTGLNYFNYQNPIDNNNDNFTDVTLQHRISIFEKLSLQRKENRHFSVAGRFFYEDRWGGEMNWTPEFRGTDSVYGESIYTSRVEILSKYELPFKEKIFLSGSFTMHDQNSFYGITDFQANQKIAFGQMTWYKDYNRNNIVSGLSLRYSDYDDNTVATTNGDTSNLLNQREIVYLPGVFIQDDIALTETQNLLIGARLDHSSIHGMIFTPRVGYKINLNKNHLIRINTGTGYRVVSVFTEDHAALTGARKTEIIEALKPERSYNINLNYYGVQYFKNGNILKIDVSPFYTYFTNKILPDYVTDPNKIIYSNIEGYAENAGIGLNLELRTPQWMFTMGGTAMSVTKTENNIKSRQLLSENFTGTWTITYSLPKIPLEIDYTGNVYGPMLLPLLGPSDPRPGKSPWWSIQNIQLKYNPSTSFQVYAGVKNLLNWVPGKNVPFLIARSQDPFDKQVVYDDDGSVQSNENNPYALTFDPAYVYGPNQGIRVFLGLRYSLK